MKKCNNIPRRPLLPEGVKESPPMLINEISQLFRAKMREKENEMTQDSTRLIIIELAHKDGATQLELAKSTHLKPPTISVTLSRLEKLGYISRVADPNDMRALRVYLTDKGRELDRDSFRRLREADDILMKGINEEESAFLTKLLTRMRDNILDALKNGEEN